MNCSVPVLHYLPKFAQTTSMSQWCHQTVSSSVTLFSSCPQSFPASGSFLISRLFTLGGQSIGTNELDHLKISLVSIWFTSTSPVLHLVTQLCPTLCNPMDYSPPGSSIQATILEWVAIPSSRGSSQPRDQSPLSCIAGGFFTIWDTREAQYISNAKQKIQWEAGAQYRETEWMIILKTILQGEQGGCSPSWG